MLSGVDNIGVTVVKEVRNRSDNTFSVGAGKGQYIVLLVLAVVWFFHKVPVGFDILVIFNTILIQTRYVL